MILACIIICYLCIGLLELGAKVDQRNYATKEQVGEAILWPLFTIKYLASAVIAGFKSLAGY